MAENDITEIGLYNASAPELAVGQYDTLEALVDVTSGLVVNPDGGEVSLEGNRIAESWWALADQLGLATTKLGEVNESFAAEIKVLRDNLMGEAGDAFHEFANGLLKKSEELYTTLDAKKFYLTVGNIGHNINSFGDNWWQIIRDSEAAKEEAELAAKTLAAAEAEAAVSEADLESVLDDLESLMSDIEDKAEKALVKDLQELLEETGRQYNEFGQDLSPLHIAGGYAGMGVTRLEDGDGEDNDDSGEGEGGGSGEGEGEGEGSGGSGGGGSGEGEGSGGEGSGGSGGGSSGGSGGGLGDAKDKLRNKALGAIDDVIEDTTDPEALDALGKARNAVSEALGGGSGGDVPGGDVSGGGLGSGGDVPAGDVSGGGLGSGGGSGGSDSTLDGLKDKALDAIDGVKQGTKDPEARDALDKAKDAVSEAFDDIGDDKEKGDRAKADDALDKVKDKALGAIDGVIEDTKDPEALDALEKAKDAVGEAFDGGGETAGEEARDALDEAIAGTDDPEARQALEEARDRIDEIFGDDANPETVSGGPGEKEDPEARRALDDAQEAIGKSFDELIAATDDPEARQALEEAKAAALEAVGEIDVPTTGGDVIPSGTDSAPVLPVTPAGSPSALEFLGGGGGGGGLGDLTKPDTGEYQARFDTDVAQERGLNQPNAPLLPQQTTPMVAQTVASQMGSGMGSGMPMGGMPMGGGMGGMGGQQNNERDPQIWMQADKDAWTDDPDGQDDETLGRTTRT